MPICSYLVFPIEGELQDLAEDLAALPGCEVEVAENREVIILVTESEGDEGERALRRRLEQIEGIRALVLTFGNLDSASKGARPPSSDRLLDLRPKSAEMQVP